MVKYTNLTRVLKDWNIHFQRMVDASSDSMSQKYGSVSMDTSSFNDNVITLPRNSSHGYLVKTRPSHGEDACYISKNLSYRGAKDFPFYCLCQKLLKIVTAESSDNTQEQYQASLVPEDESNLDSECQVFSQDEDGDTLLHIAIIQQREDYAVLFIELCSDPCLLDIQNNLFQTALLLAVLTQQTTIVKRLVKKGALLTYQDHRGDTALHAACRRGNLTVVKVLAGSMTFKQSLEIRNSDGLTCLHLAVRSRNLILLQFLLEKNVDVNAKELKTGITVLHWAAENGNVDVLKFLFTCSDVDVNAVTYDSKTALELARGNGFADVVMDLLYKGTNEKSDSDDISGFDWDEE